MRILFLAHRIPYPPNKGDKIRAFHEVRHLSRRHEVHLACLVDREEDFDYLRNLEEICKTVTAVSLGKVSAYFRTGWSLLRGRPLSPAYFSSPELRWLVSGMLERMAFERVVVFSSSMAPYVASHRGCPKILDMVDVDSDKWRQYAARAPFPRSKLYALEANRLSRYERELATDFDQVVFVAAPELELYRRTARQAQAVVVTNGVDTTYFFPPEQRVTAPRLVFTGAMDYHANVDAMTYFCDDVLPLIRARLSDTELTIVGSNPTPAVRRLAARAGVTVTGTVPDVRPYLASARVFVAPFRIARGIQNKILEALATGLPVVVSPVASAALPAGEGWIEAPDREAFAGAVVALLQNPTNWEKASREARRLVEKHFDWSRSMELFEEIVLHPRGVESQVAAPSA
jgi:sugar transferase (PEP-CTERM/EpsH1 system associated)